MREIKFKAKTCNGEWVEGFLFELFFEGTWCIGKEALEPNDYSEIIGQNKDWFYINPDTICQYTGLKDKNGKEIYEGDILRTEIEDNQYRNYLVKFDEKELSYELYGNDDLEYRVTCTRYNQIIFEVIGNIFDNPELLDADKQARKNILFGYYEISNK